MSNTKPNVKGENWKSGSRQQKKKLARVKFTMFLSRAAVKTKTTSTHILSIVLRRQYCDYITQNATETTDRVRHSRNLITLGHTADISNYTPQVGGGTRQICWAHSEKIGVFSNNLVISLLVHAATNILIKLHMYVINLLYV